MSKVFDLWNEVGGAFGPSGREDAVRETIAGIAGAYIDDVTTDALGNLICRKKGDRPAVVPNGVVNFAFLGNHAETFRDTVFTTEYSVRTAMEAVYTLCHVDRGVPEVFNSVYDVRVLMQSTKKLMDGRRLTDMKLPLPKFITKPVIRAILKKVDKTEIGTLLRRYDMVDFDL